ncbi:hypothetical protein [Cribrihabitans pelagius]|uniref:hypothetical protein n=1 Tax=Cribrihabitans pelagius TaxID=1765746 RepID=UPI003B5C0FC1
MSKTNTRNSGVFLKTGKIRPHSLGRTLPGAAALGLLLSLAGCGPLGVGGPGGAQVMQMAGGSLRLAPPQGFCVEPRSSSATASGGFALLVPCGRNWQPGRKGAVLTAAAGPAAPGTEAPSARDIAAMFPGAELQASRTRGPLPLVRLKHPAYTAKGASPVHWRGAFVMEGYLVALALYAPEGSRALGPRGAELLEELTRATLAASAEPAPQGEAPEAAAPAEAPEQTAYLLRPRAHPRRRAPSPAATSFASGPTTNFAARIAGWFR